MLFADFLQNAGDSGRVLRLIILSGTIASMPEVSPLIGIIPPEANLSQMN